MPIQPMEPTEYIKYTADVTSVIIKRSIENAYPKMPPKRRDDLVVGVIERLARMHDYTLRRGHDTGDGE
jgi:hypothetical protein